VTQEGVVTLVDGSPVAIDKTATLGPTTSSESKSERSTLLMGASFVRCALRSFPFAVEG
jgi:hypothetical protein